MTPSHKPSPIKRPKRRDTARSGDSLRPVTQVVRPLIKKILPQKSAIFQQIFDVWPDITAGTDAAGTIPEKVTFPRNQQNWGILSLWAKSGGQAMELTYNKNVLLQRINSVFGYAMLAGLRVMAHPGATQPRPPVSNSATVPPRGMGGHDLAQALDAVANPALRSILSEFGGVLPADTPATLHNTLHNKGDQHA